MKKKLIGWIKIGLEFILPVQVIQFLKYMFLPKILSGCYQEWEGAVKKSGGYNSELIFSKIENAAVLVKENVELYERDGVIFKQGSYNQNFLSTIGVMKLFGVKEVSILDFGGSLGSTYYQHRKLMTDTEWSIVEQKHFVEKGKNIFEAGNLKFFYSIDECLSVRRPNLILFSSVLQYIEDYENIIDKIKNLNFDWIFIDRTPFFDSENDSTIISVQKVPKTIYNASYPIYIFSFKDFIKKFEDRYQLIQTYQCDEIWKFGLNKKVYFKGVLLKRFEKSSMVV